MNPSRGTRTKERARRIRRPYQTVAIGLYEDQTRAIDRAIHDMQQAGYTKANRSLIFQTLAKRFLEDIEGLSHEQMLEYLLRAHLKRPLAHALARDHISKMNGEAIRSVVGTRIRRGRAV